MWAFRPRLPGFRLEVSRPLGWLEDARFSNPAGLFESSGFVFLGEGLHGMSFSA